MGEEASESGLTVLEEVQFAMAAIAEYERTVVVPPGFGERMKIELGSAAAHVEVIESKACPPGKALVFDVNALKASLRARQQGSSG